MLIKSYAPGLDGNYRDTWRTPHALWALVTATIALIASGLFVAIAANRDEADYRGRIIGKNLHVTQMWIGIGLLGFGILAALSIAVFVVWRHESRHQTQAILEGMRENANG